MLIQNLHLVRWCDSLSDGGVFLLIRCHLCLFTLLSITIDSTTSLTAVVVHQSHEKDSKVFSIFIDPQGALSPIDELCT